MIRLRATIDDLQREQGKAELVNGAIVRMSPAGDFHGRSSGAIYFSLYRHEKQQGGGRAYGDNVGFLCDLPHRDSFSPDAAWYTGPTAGEDFLPEPPAFAVEIRSKNEYGPTAELAMAEKRDDYFAAGTKVVWDVDLFREKCVRVYRTDSPETPTIYRVGQFAEAEPAVPGWQMPVAELFE